MTMANKATKPGPQWVDRCGVRALLFLGGNWHVAEKKYSCQQIGNLIRRLNDLAKLKDDEVFRRAIHHCLSDWRKGLIGDEHYGLSDIVEDAVREKGYDLLKNHKKACEKVGQPFDRRHADLFLTGDFRSLENWAEELICLFHDIARQNKCAGYGTTVEGKIKLSLCLVKIAVEEAVADTEAEHVRQQAVLEEKGNKTDEKAGERGKAGQKKSEEQRNANKPLSRLPTETAVVTLTDYCHRNKVPKSTVCSWLEKDGVNARKGRNIRNEVKLDPFELGPFLEAYRQRKKRKKKGSI